MSCIHCQGEVQRSRGDRPKTGDSTPNVDWRKNRGEEPPRHQKQFTWFCRGGAFTGDRGNDIRLLVMKTRAAKSRAARQAAETEQ